MKKVRLFGILALICGTIAVTFLMEFPTWLKVQKGDIKDYNMADINELKRGDAVRGTVDMTLGPCAEEYSTSYGVRTSSKSDKLYYVLWMDNGNLVLYETGNSGEFNTLDRITDETYDYFESLDIADQSGDMADVVLPTTTMQLEGIVKKIPSNIEGYFREFYDDVFDDNLFASSTEAVMISRIDFDRFSVTVWIGIGAAVLCIVFLILTIMTWRKEKYNQQFGY